MLLAGILNRFVEPNGKSLMNKLDIYSLYGKCGTLDYCVKNGLKIASRISAFDPTFMPPPDVVGFVSCSFLSLLCWLPFDSLGGVVSSEVDGWVTGSSVAVASVVE